MSNPPHTNFAAAAQAAWLEEHRPFAGKKGHKQVPSTPPPMERADAPPPNPADVDPRWPNRHLPMIEDTTTGELIRARAPTTREQAIAVIQEAFQKQAYTMADLTPARIKVAYRVLLSIAMATRAMRVGESLSEVTEIKTYDMAGAPLDPWTQTRELPPQLPISTMVLARESEDDGTADADGVPDYRHIAALADLRERYAAGYVEAPTISLLPPPIPARWIRRKGPDAGTVHPDYDPSNPEHDMQMVLYTAVFRGTYNMLGIQRGAYRDQFYGVYGYIGLDDASTLRQAFPTRGEILAFESILISDILKMIVDKDTMATYGFLEAEYGFSKKECKWIIEMAMNHASDVVNTDVNQQKNITILRIEDLIRRLKGKYDTKTEVAAIKLLSLVLGITRSEPEDFNSKAGEFMRNWNSQSGEKLLRSQTLPPGITLPPPALIPTDSSR